MKQSVRTKKLFSRLILTKVTLHLSTSAVSHVHFVGGEKGGVGKSVVARLLSQFAIDRKLSFAGIDADVSHGALVRYYSEFSRASDLEDFDSADQIMDRALGADRRVIVDLPAQSARYLKRWIESGDVLSFAADMGVPLSFWHVTDGGFDSVSELKRLVDDFGESLHYVVVKNYGRSTDFSQFERSSAIGAVRELGGRIIDLPALQSSTMYKIDAASSSFWAAINAVEGEFALTAMEKQRTKLWLGKVYEQFDGLGPAL